MHDIDARTLTVSQKEKVLERDYGICIYCGDEATEVDHIMPWSYIHDNSEANLVACCSRCNCLASSRVFGSFEEKLKYIQNKNKNRPLNLFRKTAFCIDCGVAFKPRVKHATLFLCPECTKKEYGRRRKIKEQQAAYKTA